MNNTQKQYISNQLLSMFTQHEVYNQLGASSRVLVRETIDHECFYRELKCADVVRNGKEYFEFKLRIVLPCSQRWITILLIFGVFLLLAAKFGYKLAKDEPIIEKKLELPVDETSEELEKLEFPED